MADTDRTPPAVLFDIDETLIHTGGSGARSWAMAFRDLHDVEADIGEHSSAGETDPQVGAATFRAVMGRDPEPAELARLYASYLRHLADDIRVSEGYRVLDGAEALLDRLADAGVVLGVVSGAMEGAARTKMEPARLGRFFVFGAYGSDSPDRVDVVRRAIATAGTLRGAAPARDEVLVVGDTPNDITSAHDAGATAVGVASGHYSADELRPAGADLVLDSLEDPALERLLGL